MRIFRINAQHLPRVLGATAIALAIAVSIAVSAGANDEPSQSDPDTPSVSKSNAPMNVNPNKTPLIDEHSGAYEPESHNLEDEANPGLNGQQEAIAAEKRAAEDASYLPCFKSDGTLAGVSHVEPVNPNQTPAAEHQRQRHCDAVYPGSSAGRP